MRQYIVMKLQLLKALVEMQLTSFDHGSLRIKASTQFLPGPRRGWERKKRAKRRRDREGEADRRQRRKAAGKDAQGDDEGQPSAGLRGGHACLYQQGANDDVTRPVNLDYFRLTVLLNS